MAHVFYLSSRTRQRALALHGIVLVLEEIDSILVIWGGGGVFNIWSRKVPSSLASRGFPSVQNTIEVFECLMIQAVKLIK